MKNLEKHESLLMLQEDPQGSFNDTFGSWGMKTLILLNVQQPTYYPMQRKYRFAFSNTFLFEKVKINKSVK